VNRLQLMVALVLAAPVAHAQTNSLAAGMSLPVGNYASAANTGFGLALLSRTDATIGPFDIRVDLTYDRLGGKGTITRFTYTSAGLSLVRDVGAGVYFLGGFSLYQASDQGGVKVAGRTGNANHTNGGAKGGLGVDFTAFGRAWFIEGNIVRLLSAPGVAWVPLRLGIRI
jgi:hypothetical protein